ncbi:MFS family permease [Paraburkholderia sp. GAS333]
MTTWFMTAIALSGVIGGPVSGYILKSFNGLNGWHGWQWLFLLEGIPSIIVGVLVFAMLDDRIANAKWLTREEQQMLERHVSAEESDKHDMPVRQVLTNGRVLMFSVLKRSTQRELTEKNGPFKEAEEAKKLPFSKEYFLNLLDTVFIDSHNRLFKNGK